MSELLAIKTVEEYRACLAEVERLVVRDPDPASAVGERLMTLVKLVEDYERRSFSLP